MLKYKAFKKTLKTLYKYKKNSKKQGVINKNLKPQFLQTEFNFSINNKGEEPKFIEDFLEKYLKYSVNTNSPQFFNQFFSGANNASLIGELITAFTNTSMYTYEVAPVATLIEKEVINKMNSLVGFNDGEGIFVTGGSNANLIAMFSARNQIFKDVKDDGITGMPKLTAFISDQFHYSFEIAANLLGIGVKNLIRVKSDDKGKMIIEELDREIKASIERGEKPFFVCGIAGTTVIGAFDDFVEIRKIADKYKIWFHVDAAVGGTLLIYDKMKPMFKGAELADSFAWDAHKLMNIPFVCSVLLTRNKSILRTNIQGVNADYLYHTENEYDLGVSSLQCGRRNEALRLWLAWKYYGDLKYSRKIANLLKITQYLASKVKENSRFKLLLEPESLCVCFQVKSPIESISDSEYSVMVRKTIIQLGKSMVNYANVKGQSVIRFTVANNETTNQDIDIFFKNLIEAVEKTDEEVK